MSAPTTTACVTTTATPPGHGAVLWAACVLLVGFVLLCVAAGEWAGRRRRARHQVAVDEIPLVGADAHDADVVIWGRGDVED